MIHTIMTYSFKSSRNNQSVKHQRFKDCSIGWIPFFRTTRSVDHQKSLCQILSLLDNEAFLRQESGFVPSNTSWPYYCSLAHGHERFDEGNEYFCCVENILSFANGEGNFQIVKSPASVNWSCLFIKYCLMYCFRSSLDSSTSSTILYIIKYY